MPLVYLAKNVFKDVFQLFLFSKIFEIQNYNFKFSSKSIPVSLQQSQLQRSIVGRSNSAITQKKNGTSKLRRHAKSEPISSPKVTKIPNF